MVFEALESRLQSLQQEILHLTELAARASDQQEQDRCYSFAQDLQREVRVLLRLIAAISDAPEGQNFAGN